MARIAVVTGGNKGIGLSIVKGLCQHFDGVVYLTARDVGRGQAAVAGLEAIGLKPKFHQLDVADDESVRAFADYLKKTHGGLDILVNNAAIAFQEDSTEPFATQVEETLKVNYFSLVRVCEALYPLLRPHARVVHVSSVAGHLSKISNPELRAQFSSPDLTVDRLNEIMQGFVNSAKKNVHEALGWHPHPYFSSKVGVSALARIHQKLFDVDDREDLVVNSVHPGYVDTDLTRHKGPLTPDRGAQAPLHLALLSENTDIRGKFVWHDNTLVDWVNGPLPAQY